MRDIRTGDERDVARHHRELRHGNDPADGVDALEEDLEIDFGKRQLRGETERMAELLGNDAENAGGAAVYHDLKRGGESRMFGGTEFRLADLHFITENPWQNPINQPIQFKVRHVDHFMPGTLTLDEQGYHIHSDEAIQGIAPGQFGCIYDAEARICLGSGEISIYKER